MSTLPPSRVRQLLAWWRTDWTGEAVADGVARFTDPAARRSPRPPSIALERELDPRGRAGDVPRPAFARVGEWSLVRLRLGRGVSLYGTGEIAGPLERTGHRTVCWNTDAFEYTDRTPSLYQSHPWVLGVYASGGGFGVLADTTHRCEIDLTRGIVFRVHGPPPPVYVIRAADPGQVVEALHALTGRIPMPPRWALGYHQCRWSYDSAERAREIAREFRDRRIPCDAIWLDIDHMRGFRCFTFDPEKFPDPKALNADLAREGFRTVWMIDPGIKVDPEYDVYASGHDAGRFVKDARGGEFHGEVWPGPCAFPDFLNAGTRRWWAEHVEAWSAGGVGGVWNDMNEPSIFKVDTKTMPEDNAHDADIELGGPGPHARYHNVYGMQMVRATREGLARARPHARPFVLTRANFIGGQRFAATWTGDNTSTWDHLRGSIPMALNLSLSGQPFCGPDIGGFVGDADGELFARWMGIGALLPFARGHSTKESKDHEPWSFGPECEHACRLALERRYRLLPYLYTLFHEATARGSPIIRPVFFLDPADPALRAIDDAFLLGPDVLVRARVHREGPCRSPMPPGDWRAFELVGESPGSAPAHPALPELFIRGGAIVPTGPAIRSTAEPARESTLLAALRDGAARGRLYEDDGDGWSFLNGDYRLATLEARATGAGAEVIEVGVEGSRAREGRHSVRIIGRTDEA